MAGSDRTLGGNNRAARPQPYGMPVGMAPAPSPTAMGAWSSGPPTPTPTPQQAIGGFTAPGGPPGGPMVAAPAATGIDEELRKKMQEAANQGVDSGRRWQAAAGAPGMKLSDLLGYGQAM